MIEDSAVLITLVATEKDFRTVPIYGKKLKIAREALMSRAKFGSIVGLGESRIFKIEREEISFVFIDNVAKFPVALRISDEEFARDFKVPIEIVEASRHIEKDADADRLMQDVAKLFSDIAITKEQRKMVVEKLVRQFNLGQVVPLDKRRVAKHKE